VIEVGYCFSYEFDKITQHDIKLKLCIKLCSPLVAVGTGTKRSLNLFFSNNCPIWSTMDVYFYLFF
jgi:hypothetical protein